VANVGTRVADTVTVYVTLPPTLQPPRVSAKYRSVWFTGL
jgi:hypothetical protein